LREGSNFNDEDREDVGGLNGMGSTLVNIFSKAFHVKVHDDDDNHYFQQTWTNSSKDTYVYNANEDAESYKPLLHPCEPGLGSVEVIAEFDETMMPSSAYTLSWARMIEMRCCLIAAMAAIDHADLTINYTCIPEEGESWTKPFRFGNFQDYLELYPNADGFITDKHSNYTIAMSLSNGGFESVGSVNGLRCDRGTHIKRFTEACAFHIREHIRIRHNVDVKPAKIISHMKVISAFKINAPEFGGQTKEELVTDLRDINFDPTPSKEFIARLIHSQIVKQIVEELHQQILQNRKQELQNREKEARKLLDAKVFSPKLYDAALAGKQPGCTLFVVEGDSAAGGFKRFRKIDGTQGVFAMQGKSMGNVIYDDELQVSDRPSYNQLMIALGLSFLKRNRYRYDNIVLAQDADMDGNCITGLMLVFFVKFFPEVIQQGRLYKLVTPMYIASKGKDVREYYSMSEFEKDKDWLRDNGYVGKYHKGLGQMKDADFKRMMHEPKLIQITMDNHAELSMYTWFGKGEDNKHMRKQYLIDTAGTNPDIDALSFAYEAITDELDANIDL
jgi:DNA gyrase/topoisomerase IV subunit B